MLVEDENSFFGINGVQKFQTVFISCSLNLENILAPGVFKDNERFFEIVFNLEKIVVYFRLCDITRLMNYYLFLLSIFINYSWFYQKIKCACWKKSHEFNINTLVTILFFKEKNLNILIT